MQNISYTKLRENLSSTLEKIESNRETFKVLRKEHKPIVMMTEEDYNSLNETLYLLSTEANADRLLESIQQAQKNQFAEVNLNDY